MFLTAFMRSAKSRAWRPVSAGTSGADTGAASAPDRVAPSRLSLTGAVIHSLPVFRSNKRGKGKVIIKVYTEKSVGAEKHSPVPAQPVCRL